VTIQTLFQPKKPAGRGRRIDLRGGGHVFVGALSLGVFERFAAYRDALSALWQTISETPIDSPEEFDAFVRKVGVDLVAGALGWRVILLEILRDSNPGREFDDAWLRANLTLPDLRRIAVAFIEENELGPVVGRIVAWVRNRAAAILTPEVTNG